MSSNHADIQSMEQLNAAIRDVSKKADISRKNLGKSYTEAKQNLTPLSLMSGLVRKGVSSLNWMELGLAAARLLTRHSSRRKKA